jgi:kumamolisin
MAEESKNHENTNPALNPHDAIDINADDPITFTVFLKSQNSHKLANLDDYNDYSKRESIVVERPHYKNDHSAHPDDVEAVEKWAAESGFEIDEMNIVERWIAMRGDGGEVERALNIKIRKLEVDDEIYYYKIGEIAVPSALTTYVEMISGIENVPVSTHKIFPKEIDLGKTMVDGEAVLPQSFEKYYKYPMELTGDGQCIGIISLGGGYEEKYLREYFKKIKKPMPDISWVSVNGGKNDPGKKMMYDYEIYMDIEIASALAPGARIVVYFAPNSRMDIVRALKKAVHDEENNPDVISMSWGALEKEFTKKEIATMNLVLKEAAALNITVITSSGDLGSSGEKDGEGLNVQLPASNPYVLSVGGTNLHIEDDKILNEHAWEENQSLGPMNVNFQTGGGYSSFWRIPSYQRNVLSEVQAKPQKRGIPDVAANASSYPGILIQVGPTEQISLGTSAATPMWAALIARYNEYFNKKGYKNVGFINPYLYHLEMTEAFNEVTEGSNGAYNAELGWDPCCGLGTPDGDKLLEVLDKFKGLKK